MLGLLATGALLGVAGLLSWPRQMVDRISEIAASPGAGAVLVARTELETLRRQSMAGAVELAVLVLLALSAAATLLVAAARRRASDQRAHDRRIVEERAVVARALAEAALRVGEEKIRSIFAESSLGMGLLDAYGRIAECNRSAERILGYDRSDLIGRVGSTLIEPDGLEQVLAAVGRISRGEAAGGHGQARFRRRDGQTIPARWQLWVLRDGEGQIQFTALVLEDLTGQESVERAWRDSEERLGLLLEATEDGIWDWSIPNDQMYLSPRCARMLGYEPEELPDAAAVRNLVHPDDRDQASRQIQAHLDGETATLIYEVRMRTRAGAWRWIQNRAKVVRSDQQGRPTRMVGAYTDVTEKRMLQSRLLLADRMASVGTVVAGVAHEINNPLAYVVSSLGFAREALAKLTAPGGGSALGAAPELLVEVRQALDEAREGTDRVRTLVRDLRTLSRSDDDAQGPSEVNKVLQSSLRFAAHETRSRARVVTQLGQVPLVEASSSRLGQVFLNLILNAAQAIPEGHSEKNEIRVVSRVDVDGAKVAVEIHDTGSGMSREVMSRIFEPFFTTKRVGEGTGLGLAICHGIVTGAGGSIQVESREGRGTSFRVLLPVAATAHAEPAQAPATPAPASPRRRGRILVIDDEPQLGRSIERLLVPNHDVVFRTSAREALALLAKGERFDLILCDLMMPDLTGMDLHERLAALQPEVAKRIVFITGGAFTERAKQFLDAVPNRHLEKPFTTEAIQKVVRDALLSGATV